jgi:type II secretory pathway pseudopilin PulG
MRPFEKGEEEPGHAMIKLPQQKTRPSAFTVTELLVAIGIVACLCMLFFPIAGRLSVQGKLVKCIGNYRQLGVALGSFAAENKGAWPSPDDNRVLPSGSSLGTWYSRVLKDANTGAWQGAGKLFPYIRDKRVYVCPANAAKMRTVNALGDYASESGTFPNDTITRGINQSRYPTLPNMKTIATMGRRAIISCQFGYASSNPKSYPLSWHDGSYPVLFTDGSVQTIRFPEGAVTGTPPNINDSTSLQITVWDFFDGHTTTLKLN